MRATAESWNEDADHIISNYPGGYIAKNISLIIQNYQEVAQAFGEWRKNDEMDKDSFMYAHMYGFHNTRQ